MKRHLVRNSKIDGYIFILLGSNRWVLKVEILLGLLRVWPRVVAAVNIPVMTRMAMMYLKDRFQMGCCCALLCYYCNLNTLSCHSWCCGIKLGSKYSELKCYFCSVPQCYVLCVNNTCFYKYWFISSLFKCLNAVSSRGFIFAWWICKSALLFFPVKIKELNKYPGALYLT